MKGQFTREELAPLAKVNVESLKEYDYFTYVTADGKKAPAGRAGAGLLARLHQPNSHAAFHAAVQDAGEGEADDRLKSTTRRFSSISNGPRTSRRSVVNLPHGCKLDVVLPREMTYAEGKALSQIPADQQNTTMAWGAQFANKILVNCP